MKTNFTPDKYWYYSMLGLPTMFMMASSENFASFDKEPVLKIAIGAFLALIGLGFGYLIARKVKDKSWLVKWSAMGLILVVLVVYVRVVMGLQGN